MEELGSRSDGDCGAGWEEREWGGGVGLEIELSDENI